MAVVHQRILRACACAGRSAQSLDTTLNIQAAGTNRVLQLKQCAVALPPTKRRLIGNFGGALDLRRWNARRAIENCQ